MKKIGILGASGYTGNELIKLLRNHPEVELVVLNSRSYEGQKVSSLYDDYNGDETYTNYSFQQINELQPDLIFSALPHRISMDSIKQLDESIKVVDLSADYRFSDTEKYEEVYDREHVDPDHDAVYGLPELFKEDIKSARIVANPGCYATACTLAVYPIQQRAERIILDCKSGWSGAGRESDYAKNPDIIKDNLVAYNLTKHRHKYEIEQFIKTKLSFTPHVIDTFQGMMCTAHVILNEHIDADEVLQMYKEFYEDSPFVLVDKAAPQIKHTQKTNLCHIGGFEIDESNQLVVVSTIDNLIKGASGQAVHNMNLMLGFEEGLGLA
ncbi:MAG: N-acetyl-gamma-glutamyl-phosphate reductase [Patescibacteria group bacterium]